MLTTAPPAHTHRVDAMRQILTLLSRGNTRYAHGRFPIREAPIWAARHDAFGAFIDEQTRYRWKKQGVATVRAIYLLDDERKRIFYWLLVSEGMGLVTEMEKLIDATGSYRLTFAGYECLRLPRKGEDGNPWTWQLTSARYAALKDSIRTAIRHKDFEKIRQWSHSLKRSPGFAGVRIHAYKLAKGAEVEWKRSAKGSFPGGSFAMGWQGRFKKARTVPLFNLKPLTHLKATAVAVDAAPKPAS